MVSTCMQGSTGRTQRVTRCGERDLHSGGEAVDEVDRLKVIGRSGKGKVHLNILAPGATGAQGRWRGRRRRRRGRGGRRRWWR